MYSCVPAKRARQRLVEGVGEDLLSARPGRRAARRSRRTCASCRASSRRALRPAGADPGTGRGVLSSSTRPIDWASRRAGSIVSTHTRRPRSAARSRECGSDRGLADAARPAAHDDAGRRVVQECIDVRIGRSSGGCCCRAVMRRPVAMLVGQLVEAARSIPSASQSSSYMGCRAT